MSNGVRLGNECYDSLPATAHLRCLRDHVIIEPLNWKPSKIIEVVYTGRPVRGRVVAIGPGTCPKRYNGPKGKRTKSWDSAAFRPCDLQIGDEVEFGNALTQHDGEFDGPLHQTFRWGDKEMIICREEDVAGVCI